MKHLILLLTLFLIPGEGAIRSDGPTGHEVKPISSLRLNLAEELPTTFGAI